jgi:predicted Zn finger-like uncharacterized protein
MAGPSSSDTSTSLATACPSCSTVFRVVQDQLKVSQGWVRCGRCHEVFNALEALFDLDVRREGDPPVPRGGAPLAAPGSLTPPTAAPQTPSAPAASAPTGPSPAPVPAQFHGRAPAPFSTPQSAPFPAPVHGGWDESSPAALPDTRKGALSAAAALRDRLAARTGAVAPPPAGRPRGGGLFVDEPVVDEAELDTRFEPKFFDAESAPGSRRPPVSGAPAAETAQPAASAAIATSAAAAVSAAPAALAAPTTPAAAVSSSAPAVAPGPADTEQRREPWLDVDTSEPRPVPAPAPRPPKDRKSSSRPAARRPAAQDPGSASAAAADTTSAQDGAWSQPAPVTRSCWRLAGR